MQEMKKCPTWGCEVSSFPWSYDASETCLLLEGQVLVTPDGEAPPPAGSFIVVANIDNRDQGIRARSWPGWMHVVLCVLA